MRKLLVWVLASAVALQVLLLAESTQQYIRYTLFSSDDKTTTDLAPVAALELNMSGNTIETLSWVLVGLIGAAILIGFTQRARAAMIGIAAASFGVVLLFAGFLPYFLGDTFIALGVAAVVATGVSALLEWRGITFYKRTPAAIPKYPLVHEDEVVR